jgi:dihydrofolate synthase/folylpolyglutamate synthase
MKSGVWTPEQAERYLLSLELFGIRFGLDRMRRLMTALGSPLEQLACVQVVGTNGKSSTTRMIAAILERHGLRTGAYLSPHLGSFGERVQVRERSLSPIQFAAAVGRAAQAAELVERGLSAGEHVTQFEALTAAAYSELGRSNLDTAVVEAGLGGRYDATSVIEPSVVALTNVALEHTRWLGPTERHVAEEKLAVVPAGATLVAGPLGAQALAVAERTARDRSARLVRIGRDFVLRDEQQNKLAVRTPKRSYAGIGLRPLGRFQRVNFAVALTAAEAFLGRELDPGAVREAAAAVDLPGRLEPVGRDPLVIFDGAHNPAAATALRESVEQLVTPGELIGVISILDDKDAAGMLSVLLPLCRRVVLTRSSHARALPPAALESLSRQLSGPPAEVVAEPGPALERAHVLAGSDGAVLVTGSIYLLSDLVRDAAERVSDAI